MGGARACTLPTALLRSCRSPAALPPLSRHAPAVLPPRSRRFQNGDDGRRLLSSCLPAATLRVFGIGGAVSACTSSLRICLMAVALAPALAGALWPAPARQLRVALAQQRSRDRRAAARRVAPEHEDEHLAEVERRAHLEPHGRPGEHAAAPKVDEDCRAVHARAHAHGHQLLVVVAPHARRGSPRRSTPSSARAPGRRPWPARRGAARGGSGGDGRARRRRSRCSLPRASLERCCRAAAAAAVSGVEPRSALARFRHAFTTYSPAQQDSTCRSLHTAAKARAERRIARAQNAFWILFLY